MSQFPTSRFLLLLICFFFAISSKAQQGLLGTGLDISVAGDLVYNQGLSDQSQADDKLTVRGAEFMFFAPIDYQFDGVLNAAAHDENGETVFEVHELFISSSRLIPRSTIKAGQFFLGIGRLNRFHQHDWAFTRAPKVHRNFFDEEGVFDTGLEYNYLLPTSHVFNWTFGITSGRRFGHSHTSGQRPKAPTHYSRLSTFFPFSTTSGLEAGTTYLRRKDGQGNDFSLYGLDLTTKWRQGRLVRSFLQSEFWYRSQEDANSIKTDQFGWYIFNEYSIGQFSNIGYRLDMSKDLSKLNSITNNKINNIGYGGLVQLTYNSSEFAKIRGTISHEFEREEGVTNLKDTRFQLQFLFIIGSHPAHDF